MKAYSSIHIFSKAYIYKQQPKFIPIGRVGFNQSHWALQILVKHLSKPSNLALKDYAPVMFVSDTKTLQTRECPFFIEKEFH